MPSSPTTPTSSRAGSAPGGRDEKESSGRRPRPSRLPADRIDPEYRRLRRQVFAGIFVGYAGYYLVRNTFALAVPDLLKLYPGYSKAMPGARR
jgi:sugar phosphate permease